MRTPAGEGEGRYWVWGCSQQGGRAPGRGRVLEGGTGERGSPAPSSHCCLPSSNLSNNKVSEIEDGAFEGAASVSELHLTANQLESIRSGMFRGLDGLRTL